MGKANDRPEADAPVRVIAGASGRGTWGASAGCSRLMASCRRARSSRFALSFCQILCQILRQTPAPSLFVPKGVCASVRSRVDEADLAPLW